MPSTISFATPEQLQQIITLWGNNRATLGLMPQDAFKESIKKKWILTYSKDNTVLGYLKFRFTNRTQTVAIVHLCIDKLQREQGIATQLLDHLVSLFKDKARGIKLNCRSDYVDASKFWTKYNFQPSGKLPSKGRNPNIHLNVWWFTFGKEDLFSYIPNDKTKVVLDFNIIAKLRDIHIDNEVMNEVGQLENDWHAGEFEFYKTSETKSEIFRDRNAERSSRSQEFIKQFPELNIDKPSINILYNELKIRFSGKTDNDISDRRQIAEAILSGFPYFVTLDENILKQKDYILSKYNLKIVTPTLLIMEIDALNNASDYFPHKLSGDSFTISKVSIDDRDVIEQVFLNHGAGEKKTELNRKIDTLFQKPKSRFQTIKENNMPVALVGTYENEKTLFVELLRTKQYALRQTIFMQNVHDLITTAVENGLQFVQITERYLTETESEILLNYGFHKKEFCFLRATRAELSYTDSLEEDLITFTNEIPTLKPIIKNIAESTNLDLKNINCYYLEKQLWPFKIIDATIPCYIIPIKANYARQLFDTKAAKQDIFGVLPTLIWNKENVYYRNINPNVETFPARILWYASAEKNSSRQMGIVCSSYLNEVVIGSAKDLFKKYQRFGVFSWQKHIEPLTGGNSNKKIKVLRFSDSESFVNPISISKIKTILQRNSETYNNFQSPKLIKPSTFIELYKLGKKYN